ncbi:MAG: ATP-dependent DNA ligase [Planctomycetota bacterium]
MKRFTRLYQELDESTKTNQKVSALVRYFQDVDESDAAWAVWFLCGHRPRRVVPVSRLRDWCAELAKIPEWLFAESYEFVGDLAETISLMLPEPLNVSTGTLHEWVTERLLPLADLDEDSRENVVRSAWNELDSKQRFIFNKLLTGGFRVGVSKKLVTRALAEFSGLSADVIAHRLMGTWTPARESFRHLISSDTHDAEISRPYPFCLANPLPDLRKSGDISAHLGDVTGWCIEWKWDGIRAQIVKRKQQVFVWSRGEELLTERFPEVVAAAKKLPDGTVLDGELVGWRKGHVLPFADLQKRITRKKVGQKILTDVPVRFLAFDVLELTGVDRRKAPFSERLEMLEVLLGTKADENSLMPLKSQSLNSDEFSYGVSVSERPIALPRPLSVASWDQAIQLRSDSREQRVEGLMLKRRDSEYGNGRVAGLWWKWKVEPYHCDAVLIYAQRGHGRRASKFTDYTFAAWENGLLIPFAKAYSGLTDAEIREVDAFIRANTIERFGPVSSVKAELVFELAFEGLQRSSRHKAGIAVRFPRIARWRKDKKAYQADTLETIRSLAQSACSIEKDSVECVSDVMVATADDAESESDEELGGLFTKKRN